MPELEINYFTVYCLLFTVIIPPRPLPPRPRPPWFGWGGADGRLKGILIGGGAAPLGGAGGGMTALAGGGLLLPTGP